MSAAAAMFRPTVRSAFLVATGAGVAYQSNYYWNTTSFFFNTAHAETLPSDAKATPKKVFPGSGFTELKLHSSEMVNHNVKKITFLLPEADSITGIEPVTSLLTQHTPEGAWIPVFRPYTPISANDEPGFVTFLIKHYPGGKASTKMHSLVPGESMKFKTLHEFDYKPNQYSSMTFIAGGSGITPIFQLTNAILKNPQDKTKIALVYANNSPEDILLKKEFDALVSKYPGRFSAIYTVSKSSPSTEGLYDTGYITKEMLLKAMPAVKGTEKDVKVLVSGPPAMTESVAGAKGGFGWTQGSIGGILQQLGYTKEQVHKF